MDVPPFAFMGRAVSTFEGMWAMTHFWLHRMRFMDALLPADDFAYIDHLWRTWAAPGYRVRPEGLLAVKARPREPANQTGVLSLYRSVADPDRYGVPEWVAEQMSVWGAVPTQPTRYMHGRENGVRPVGDAIPTDPRRSTARGLPGRGDPRGRPPHRGGETPAGQRPARGLPRPDRVIRPGRLSVGSLPGPTRHGRRVRRTTRGPRPPVAGPARRGRTQDRSPVRDRR